MVRALLALKVLHAVLVAVNGRDTGSASPARTHVRAAAVSTAKAATSPTPQGDTPFGFDCNAKVRARPTHTQWCPARFWSHAVVAHQPTRQFLHLFWLPCRCFTRSLCLCNMIRSTGHEICVAQASAACRTGSFTVLPRVVALFLFFFPVPTTALFTACTAAASSCVLVCFKAMPSFRCAAPVTPCLIRRVPSAVHISHGMAIRSKPGNCAAQWLGQPTRRRESTMCECCVAVFAPTNTHWLSFWFASPARSVGFCGLV